MSILLTHTTALEVLRRWELRKALAKGERCVAVVPGIAVNREDLASLDAVLAGLARPLEVMVSERSGLSGAPDVRAHLRCGPLPEGSGVRVAKGVCCSSPEELAIQMAPRLTHLELVCLLAELMGTYVICPSMEDGMFERDAPLTTPDLVGEYLRRAGSRRGTRMVRRALEDAPVGSASPRETKLSLRLSLKPSLGGYNLRVLSLNERVEVRQIANWQLKGERRPDILVASPDGTRVVAVEYLGRHHNKPARLVQDANRTNELKAMGISEYVLRKEQYDDVGYLDGIVGEIRAELGYPRIGMTRATSRRRRELREGLLHELEAIDGVSWLGRERAARRLEVAASADGDRIVAANDVVPVEAYGLG